MALWCVVTKTISVALLPYPDSGLALSEYKQLYETLHDSVQHHIIDLHIFFDHHIKTSKEFRQS